MYMIIRATSSKAHYATAGASYFFFTLFLGFFNQFNKLI